MIREALSKVIEGRDLSAAEVRATMDCVMNGEATPAQVAGWLVAMRMKGETAEELGGAAASMREHANFIDAGARTVIDTCGTGGDGLNTFNISTTTALVAVEPTSMPAKVRGDRPVPPSSPLTATPRRRRCAS